ncbi:NAD-dependent epimerase/dehydratase family protein [Embleya sp. NPDC059237]|uniref:NAD-dependent epimerase/dehydratase family protein n=1 Tax=Embleya sp. NPDC059237 TaxID=3346784 RepID=UPI00369E3610
MNSLTSPIVERTLRTSFAGRRIVVTGAAGFLGSYLCTRLIGLGATVVGIDDLSTGSTANLVGLDRDKGFELIRHDVSERFELSGRVDHVLHAASPASPRDYLARPLETLKTGALGTLHGLELAQTKGARFLLTSTSEIYGDPLQHPQAESYWGNVNPIGPRSVYDEAKRYAEALTTAFRRQGLVDTVIVRIFNTYGPRMRADDGRMVPAFVHQALDNRRIMVTGTGSQTRALCFVDDTVNGILQAAAGTYAGPFNLGCPHEITVLEVAKLIQRLCGGADLPVAFIPLPQDDPRRRCPDIAAAKGLLGWEPHVTLETGLRHTIEWIKADRAARADVAALESVG